MTSPDQSVYRPAYNEASLLEKIDVVLEGTNATGKQFGLPSLRTSTTTPGARIRIDYANGAATTYDYEEETFRLIRLRTVRPQDGNRLATGIFTDAATIQDLHYTYDPAGNITQIGDHARERCFMLITRSMPFVATPTIRSIA